MTRNRWSALAVIGMSVFFSLSLWFSASVIAPELQERWELTSFMEALLSVAVSIGFVLGAFFSAYLGLADRFNTRKLFAVSALVGALLNVLLMFVHVGSIGILIRILTGASLAGVYPPGVKLIAQWFPKQRGLATGVLIAALTLGTSFPHFIHLFARFLDGRVVLIVSSILPLTASLLMWYVLSDAPGSSAAGNRFSLASLKNVVRNKPVMLANYGYFGHMWELYGMWTWLPAFLAASFMNFSSSLDPAMSTLVAFLSIGVAGGIGCILGGVFADKIGRANLTIIAMVISAVCALLIGLTYGYFFWLTIGLAVVWRISVVADSAQFSAAVSDFADARYAGTALTFQMCVGFLITVISINLIPLFQDWIGWEWVFSILAIGPILGIVSMVRFKVYEDEHA